MEAVRMIVQEWMQEEENKEILECISECDDKREVTFDMLKILDSMLSPPLERKIECI